MHLLKTIGLILTLNFVSLTPALSFSADEAIKLDKNILAEQTNTGGDMTVKRLSTRSFIYAGKGATRKQQLDFWTGFSLFRDPWVTAPSATKDRDGLGPLFNARSCIACHQAGGRAAMSKTGESIPTALIMRLGFTTPEIDHSNNVYGGQIQPRVTKFVDGQQSSPPSAEAWLSLEYTLINGQFADGETYQLQHPKYTLTRLGYGALPEHALPSPRYAPNIFGAGLLDAISDEDLLAQEENKHAIKQGISAKYNRVYNVKSGQMELGRFGFKAKHPTLYQQVAAAFRDDIGITNSYFTDDSCTKQQVLCIQASKLGEHENVEIPDKLLNLVVTFNRLLGVPPARNLSKPQQQSGQLIFHQLGCQQCHTPSYITDKNYPVAALAKQKIWPYTDLALHDMGEGLADGVYEYQATGSEWRTPPLWGIGLQKKITGHQRFLHDGRARSINEAILWHGGEAADAQHKYTQLTKVQRQALLTFLKSI
ncbi:MAG: di-heme oxidoredictase family protein [Litorilituus sp.]|jgi:CxxC motif-containing protein (DUF1111 family)|nr:di-heme oxidoredictase family protein [Litorilituus sp.]